MKELLFKLNDLIFKGIDWLWNTKISVFNAIAAAAFIGMIVSILYVIITDCPLYYWVKDGEQYAFCIRSGVVILVDDDEQDIQ